MSGYFLRNLLAVCYLALLGDSLVTESIQFSVSLTGRLNGKLGVNVFVGNATASLLRNVSLSLDIKAVLNESRNLIDAHGFVRDANANRKLDLSTIQKKEEEIVNLLNYFCIKEGEHKLNIVPNSNWSTLKEAVFERKQQADLLIVDGTYITYRSENYTEYVNKHRCYLIRLKWNFFIAEDGSVFEGLGFDFYDKIENGGLGPRSLIFGFIKSERDAGPSEKAMNTFHQLVKLAICSRKLIPLYKLIPYYLIWDVYKISNKSFERNQMTHWDRYQSDMEFLSPYQKREKFDLRIVPYSDFSEKVIEHAINNSGPAENVVIMETKFSRCFYNCSSIVRYYIDYYTIRGVSYIIPDDGYIYEFNGWGKTNWDWVKEKKAVLILLAGEFHSYGPNTIVFSALKALIKEGLNKGYLSANYKIVSLKEYIPYFWNAPGKYLENQIKKLDLSKIQ